MILLINKIFHNFYLDVKNNFKVQLIHRKLEKYRINFFLIFLRNNVYMPYISSTLDGKRQTIIQDPLLHTSLLDSLNSIVVNDEDYSLNLDRNECFLLYFY